MDRLGDAITDEKKQKQLEQDRMTTALALLELVENHIQEMSITIGRYSLSKNKRDIGYVVAWASVLDGVRFFVDLSEALSFIKSQQEQA